MADVLSTVSIALLLAGKVSRNLQAVCHPPVFASPSTGETLRRQTELRVFTAQMWKYQLTNRRQ
jgi:hypothetical protein